MKNKDARKVRTHNLLSRDLPAPRRPAPDPRLLSLPVVDTLHLSPLAFPQNPYHRLVIALEHRRDADLRSSRLLALAPVVPGRVAAGEAAGRLSSSGRVRTRSILRSDGAQLRSNRAQVEIQWDTVGMTSRTEASAETPPSASSVGRSAGSEVVYVTRQIRRSNGAMPTGLDGILDGVGALIAAARM
jgi:hypothetical protein